MNYNFLLSFFLILVVHCSEALPIPFVLHDTLLEYGLNKWNLEILEDSAQEYTIDEVSSTIWDDKFQSSEKEYPTNEKTNSAYWLRFTLQNRSLPKKKWIIEFFDHNINHITFYTPQPDGSYEPFSLGNMHPFQERLLKHKNLEFDLYLPPDKSLTYYVRIVSKNENVIVPIVRSLPLFVSYALGEYYLLGVFYGILGLVALYNLLLFIALRTKFYLYYTLYVLAVLLFTMCQNGLAFSFLWPKYPQLNNYAMEFSVFASVLFLVLFTVNFLKLKKQFPWLFNTLLILFALRTLVFLAGVFFFEKLVKYTFLDLILFTITYSSLLFLFAKGLKANRNFIFAYTLVYITFMVTILEQYGWIASTIFTVYSLNIGTTIEIILLSISLAQQMRAEIKHREMVQKALLEEIKEKEHLTQKINRELEEKVRQRTVELDEANAKLQKQVVDITNMNIQLDVMNWKLRQNVNEIAEKRIVKPVAAFDEFLEVYSNENACYRLLSKLKSQNGFFCKNCEGSQHGKGKGIFDRRCTKCGYNESITANTLYHKLKFPIEKAFYMTHIVFTRPEISTEELSLLIDLRKETCYSFKSKIIERMNMLNKKELKSWDVLVLNSYFENRNKHTVTLQNGLA